MSSTLSFLGGAGNVTGSRFLIEGDGSRVLVDCGLYQERELLDRNWSRFPVPPDSIDAVLLTHAHLDHSGYLPKLVRDGFRGRIHCTPATAEIAEIILKDSARIQEEDAAFKRRRHEREGRMGPHPEIPLYTVEDAERVPKLFSTVEYRTPFKVTRNVTAEFRDAGHILGSATVKVTTGRRSDERITLFSGDLGRWDRPLLHDPDVYDQADYVVMESTYGARLHNNGDDQEIEDRLAEVVNSTVEAGGNLVIPSFAVERAQELLYYLRRLTLAKRIPRLMVFLDSPMAIDVSEIFGSHPDLLKPELAEAIRRGDSPFDFPGLMLTRTADQSKSINRIRGTAIIIAGSGMCNGGRIKHHLVQNIERPESTVLFVGYQAHGTLGRQIVSGQKQVRILGQQYAVRSRIVDMEGFSAHADRDELVRWATSLERRPERVFLVHGEDEALDSLSGLLRERTGWDVTVPAFGDTVNLS